MKVTIALSDGYSLTWQNLPIEEVANLRDALMGDAETASRGTRGGTASGCRSGTPPTALCFPTTSARRGTPPSTTPRTAPARRSSGLRPCPLVSSSDATPVSGVLRIDRVQGKHTGPYETQEAYLPEEGSYLCRSIQRVGRVGDDAPLFIGSGSEITAARSYLLATWDGWQFVKVWEDPELQPAGRGTRSVVGPTVQGKVIIGSNDEKVPGMWSRITMPAPGY